MLARRILALLAALAILALAATPTAAAHKTVYSDDGKIKIVWGFLNEPAVTWTKTGIDLILSDNATGAPITGVAETLEVHLKHGNDDLHFDNFRAQHGQAGRYTDVVTLTKPGIYTLVLHGTINGTTVDMQIPSAHEISSVDETFFPKVEQSPYAGTDTSGLKERIEALEKEVATLKAQSATQSATPATVTPQAGGDNGVPSAGLALVALGAVVAALALRRR